MSQRTGRLAGLVGAGGALVLLGLVQVVLSGNDAAGYGIATGGALAVCAGALARRRNRPT